MARDFLLQRPNVGIAGTDTGQGPAIVLLHAGGERRGVWKPVAERLALAGFRSIAIDQRGHGDTHGHSDKLADFVDDASALLDFIRVPAVLVGASLGGFVSLLAATQRAAPGRVAAIILVDVIPDPDANLSRAYLQLLQTRAGDEQRWNWNLVEDILSHAEPLRLAAAQAQVPIALIRGEQGVVRAEDVARLQALVPTLQLRCVAGAGHLVARHRPDKLSEVLIELFGSLKLSDWRPG